MDRNLILLQIGICVGRGNKPITIAIRRAVAAVEDHKFQSMSPINERVRGVLFCRILAQTKREWWVTVVSTDWWQQQGQSELPTRLQNVLFGQFFG